MNELDEIYATIQRQLDEAEWSSGRTDKLLQWLDSQLRSQAKITVGIPDCDTKISHDWLGKRFVWWPNGIPTGRRIGIISSRLGRRLDDKSTWFAALRNALKQVTDQDLLISIPKTTTDRFVVRGAHLFQRRLLRIAVDQRDDRPILGWLNRIRQGKLNPCCSAYLSPQLPDDENCDVLVRNFPLRDRAMIAISDQLCVLRLRSNGVLDNLIQHRLAATTSSRVAVSLATGRNLVPPNCAEHLTRRGATSWFRETGTSATSSTGTKRHPVSRPRVRQNRLPDLSEPHLSHCTRRRTGPWPDQSNEQYLDELLLNDNPPDHSALATLCRIITDRRLIASSVGIRGKIRVVSWTSVPLSHIAELRIYRPHRLRWDFEPYGISVRRDWLAENGAQPVRYGSRQEWEGLNASERPFFQLASTTAPIERKIDWTGESEWRTIGDLDLREVPADALIVFVSSEDEFERIAQISPWKVTVLPQQ